MTELGANTGELDEMGGAYGGRIIEVGLGDGSTILEGVDPYISDWDTTAIVLGL